ncbi:MAG: glucose 1-dehydrogenase [Dehalococcoidia bacterium]|nr:glucose 1-dehydrogenase [Dehalococcoidia bacterium]
MPGILQDKSALITGGASGIGRAIALAFAAEGARVVIADIAGDGGRETVRMIEAQGGHAAFCHADCTQSADVQAMVRFTMERYGRLDCACNNAGIGGIVAPLHDLPVEEFDRVLAINMRGVFLGLKYEIPQMIAQGGGVIVNTASTAAFMAGTEAPAYAASKAGVASLTRSAAKAYAARGVRVNAVCPGATETPLLLRRDTPPEDLKRRHAARIPLGRIAQPAEIAQVVLWLCSPAASYVTGLLHLAAGGILA